MASLSKADLQIYSEACRLAADVPLIAALEEWRKARRLVGPDLLRACESWATKHNLGGLLSCTVAEAATRYEKEKTNLGIKVNAGIKRTIPRFAEKFAQNQLASVTPVAINAWLDQFKRPSTRNSHRKRIVAFFNWARKAQLVPMDTLTAAERTDSAREPRSGVQIVTPAQLKTALFLIQQKKPEYVPALVLASFCGLRRAEVHGPDWKDILVERGFVRVTAAKPNTPAHRLVPLCEAAKQWLKKFQQLPAGPVCTSLAIDRIRDICRTAGLDLADNGLRHSFITYRVAETGNVAATSIEAGNSAAIIFRHYRELATKDEASDWFGLSPVKVESGAKVEEEKNRVFE